MSMCRVFPILLERVCPFRADLRQQPSTRLPSVWQPRYSNMVGAQRLLRAWYFSVFAGSGQKSYTAEIP